MTNEHSSDDNQEHLAFKLLLDHIRTTRGFDFTGYKPGSLFRRVRKRMSQVGIEGIESYIDFLQVHPEEFAPLFDAILINVTAFFRDPDSWDYLKREIIPAILSKKESDQPIRVWSAGCSSGEEPYSIAMLLAELLGMQEYLRRVKIYATDVDEAALNQGRQAIYTAEQVNDLPPGFCEKYLESTANGYIIRTDLRRAVIFGRHDLVQDAPISRIDLLICRNTLMYLNAETQRRIISRFHYALDEHGYLFAGKSEMLLTPDGFFQAVALKYRIFRKVQRAITLKRSTFVTQSDNELQSHTSSNADNLALLSFDKLLFAQIILNAENCLVLANKSACATFKLIMTDIGRPLQDLELSYRPLELRSVIEEARAAQKGVTVNKVSKFIAPGQIQILEVHVEPLDSDGSISVSFRDVTSLEKLKEDFARSLQELETTNEELHSAQEELETTNEELQSTNEELETTNEELQSTNEELETMNEELASTNDEMESANAQLRSLSVDMNRERVFMESILSSIKSAIIVVNRELDVLNWNRRAQDLWGLRSDEVIGKKLAELDIGLPTQELDARILAQLSENGAFDELRLDAINRRGQKFVADIRITPINVAGEPASAIVLLVDERNSTLADTSSAASKAEA